MSNIDPYRRHTKDLTNFLFDKGSLLEQLRHQLEKQDLEEVREFVKALDDVQWLELDNQLRALGCHEWARLFLKLLYISESHDSSSEGSQPRVDQSRPPTGIAYVRESQSNRLVQDES